MAERYCQNFDEPKLIAYSSTTQLQSSLLKDSGSMQRIYTQQHNSLNRIPQFCGNTGLQQNFATKFDCTSGVFEYPEENMENFFHPIQSSNVSLVGQQQPQIGPYGSYFNNRNRYTPYSTYRPYTNLGIPYQQQQQITPICTNYLPMTNILQEHNNKINANISNNETSSTMAADIVANVGGNGTNTPSIHNIEDQNGAVTLQISNLDYTMDESSLRHFLLGQLKPITPVQSLVFESNSCAKVAVPDIHCAKQVVSNLHRKKIGHKRVVVSYTRDSSLTEINTLKCQVAGLLKDVPHCTLPMYKFRELFQSRFKTSISVVDLYKMQNVCNITTDKNDEKYITLHPDLMNSIENSPLLECLQHSVPYCTIHFKKEQHKGWAEQDIEPLPNVFMTISEIQQIIYPLLKRHTGDIPVASLIHCIEGELGAQITPNENGVNLEHLVCCVQGIQVTTNNFGIKILGWLEPENSAGKDSNENRSFPKSGSLSDPLYQLSREVIELIKMCPKSTMKFNRFIPAYHNHFGKQCRVADYGYTKLIELFEALSSVIQLMGDGENRQITLTHRTQIRRFTSDLLRIIRSQGNKSILLSQLPSIFSLCQNRNFDVTEYGVCDVVDILDGLVNSNIVVLTTVQNGNDIVISIPKRKQTPLEIERTSTFAGECVELLRNAPQYSIQFQKFVRSYHYHFGYQCRLSDYGFLKLADLMEAIQGVVEIEIISDEDKKIFLSPLIARRVFAEQLEELIQEFTGSGKTQMKLDEVFELHKKKFGYKIQPQTLGVHNIMDAIKMLPYIEIFECDDILWIICHLNDHAFRSRCYEACKIIQESGKELMSMNDFKNAFYITYNEQLLDRTITAMKHAIEIRCNDNVQFVRITKLMKFLLKIIGLLEKRFLNLSEIKSNLRVGISDCFELGYPNLFLLIKAFSDIFIIEMGSLREKCEIGLVPKLILASKNANYFRCRNNSGANVYGRRSATPLQDYNNANNKNNDNNCLAFGHYVSQQEPHSRPIKMLHHDESKYTDFNPMHDYTSAAIKYNNDIYFDNSGRRNSMQLHQNLMQNCNKHTSNMSGKQPQHQQHSNGQSNLVVNGVNNKENFRNDISSSLNSSSGSDPNSSCGSINNGFTYEPSKLWLRHSGNLNESYTSSSADIYDILNIPLSPNYCNPPKPDTPTSENVPFWIDPIWAINNGERQSPKIDSFKIQLPELKSYNILPVLMSPYSLSKLENMKQMFSFDKFDANV